MAKGELEIDGVAGLEEMCGFRLIIWYRIDPIKVVRRIDRRRGAKECVEEK
jgi:hypothetical protein